MLDQEVYGFGTILCRSGTPPKLQVPSFNTTHTVIPWTHTVWKGIHSNPAHKFGTTSECLDAWDKFYADKPEIFWRQIRIWRRHWDSYRIITEEIYTRILAHSEQIHSARYVTDAFFYLLELCKIIIWSNWDFELPGLRLRIWEINIWELGFLVCAPTRICKPNFWS